ncbi:MAG TPA: prolyl oligopeptidase family serine peptidase [Candidatus Eremiobacteraceae bacterium]|nr:prolyl oligopeptidase family serine peptidase [Candidatus Eremiobacteraceae bacterium]
MLRSMVRYLIIGLSLLALLASVSAAATTPAPSASPAAAGSPSAPSAEATDPYIWLEDVHGAKAMAWVEAENAKTLGVLEKDPRFAEFYANALKIAEAKDRIPAPEFIQSQIFNYWQDNNHVRGIWRRTTLADYSKTSPAWDTVLDLDALAKSENANWVWHGADCYWPQERRCLLHLSDGGEDADTIREFDLTNEQFPAGGFVLPRGKQDVAWEDGDTLLAAREWNPGEMTTSGYPYVVKRLKRGQPLAGATEVFRGMPSDVGVSPFALHDGQGHRAVMIVRNTTFFTSEYYLVTSAGTRKLEVPPKADVSAMIAGRLLLRLRQDWAVNGTAFIQGSLVSLDLAAVTADPEHLVPTLVYAPGPRESLDGVDDTRAHLIITTLDNVRGRAYVYTPLANGGWSKRQLALADNSAISLAAADQHDENAFLYVTSFLTPTSLWLTDAGSGSLAMTKASPARFDASGDVVEQHEATSEDGTQIPYFIVHPKQMKLDGSNPTILYAYGGFQISETPAYSGLLGKLWLERGGVYVLANIRGGGEFGPAWHDAGLTVHRQRIYDDFAAVAQDLIARKITSPRRLGIQGGSNGGLLMGVEFTQHPELWNAVDIQVPLLDMLRYEQIAAGASWVAEYGSVSNPEQRAFLASISPYNNIKPGVAYPQPLIWTTTKDDRVGPQHARKFAAKLQAMGIPYYFYEVTEGGHGAGANLNERAHTTALEMIYFTRKLMDD